MKALLISLVFSLLTISLFGQELIPYCEQGKCGFKNGQGNISIPMAYEAVGNFYEGYAAVKQKGKWGFINMEGKKLVSLKI